MLPSGRKSSLAVPCMKINSLLFVSQRVSSPDISAWGSVIRVRISATDLEHTAWQPFAPRFADRQQSIGAKLVPLTLSLM